MSKLALSSAELVDIRKFAVDMAARWNSSPAQVIEQARAIADFIVGTNDAEVIAAARDLAGKVG